MTTYSWTVPKTWAYRDTPGYTTLNDQLRDNLNYIDEVLVDHDPIYAYIRLTSAVSISNNSWIKPTGWTASKDDSSLWDNTNNETDLTEGIWWVYYRACWDPDDAGRRGVGLYTGSSQTLLRETDSFTSGAWSGTVNDHVELTRLVTVGSSGTNAEFYCLQSSGSALNLAAGAITVQSNTKMEYYKLSGTRVYHA
jgi:hypothetical protein